jgi:hypothetical protein
MIASAALALIIRLAAQARHSSLLGGNPGRIDPRVQGGTAAKSAPDREAIHSKFEILAMSNVSI